MFLFTVFLYFFYKVFSFTNRNSLFLANKAILIKRFISFNAAKVLLLLQSLTRASL